MTTELVLDALEQAIHARQAEKGLICHNDHGSQYLSIRYTERLGLADEFIGLEQHTHPLVSNFELIRKALRHRRLDNCKRNVRTAAPKVGSPPRLKIHAA